MQTFALGVALLLAATLTARPAQAAVPSDPAHRLASPAAPSTAQNQPQLVFTMGVVARLGRDAVTVRFDDGQTETYRLTDTTTFQTEAGGAASLADLDVGDMVMIIAPEHGTTAITVVDAGDRGFDAGGPFDIGADEGA